MVWYVRSSGCMGLQFKSYLQEVPKPYVKWMVTCAWFGHVGMVVNWYYGLQTADWLQLRCWWWHARPGHHFWFSHVYYQYIMPTFHRKTCSANIFSRHCCAFRCQCVDRFWRDKYVLYKCPGPPGLLWALCKCVGGTVWQEPTKLAVSTWPLQILSTARMIAQTKATSVTCHRTLLRSLKRNQIVSVDTGFHTAAPTGLF